MDELVSVIMPTYKRHRDLVKRALDSLLSQTYKNTEIVLVDDNAGDELSGFRKEIEELAGEYPKVVYVRNEKNFGSAKSRNFGIKKAQGNYITFLDDDDIYLKDKIEKQLCFMIENELDMSFTNQILVDKNNRIVDFREYRRIKKFDNKTLLQYHLSKKITGTNTFMVKKEILQSIGGFGEVDMGDEFYLMYNIIKTQCKIGYLDENEVVAYRAGQFSLTVGEKRLIYEKRLYEFIKKNFNELTFSQRAYARFRYNVTKLITYKRAKKYGKMLICIVNAFFSSPKSFFVEPFRMRKNLKEIKKLSLIN